MRIFATIMVVIFGGWIIIDAFQIGLKLLSEPSNGFVLVGLLILGTCLGASILLGISAFENIQTYLKSKKEKEVDHG